MRTSGNINNETEINNLPDKEFQALVIRMLTELGKRIDELWEFSQGTRKYKKKTQSEMKNSITKIKNTLQGNNSTLSDV